MIILHPNQYENIKFILSDILGANWHLESIAKRNIGAVVVDAFPDTNTVFLETPFFFYYFAGKYNQAFMEENISRIAGNPTPQGEKKPLFIFSSNQEWKTGIESQLKPYVNKRFGAYLTRRLLHLNRKKYEDAKARFVIPDGYVIEMRTEKNSVSAVALCDGLEVCKCNDGGRGLGFMDLDVFTHPEHRNKGLALQCCSLVIDYSLKNNLTPQWGCWTVNIPSCRLADKLGFDVTAETFANFAER